MNETPVHPEAVLRAMLKKDEFSRWLGLEVDEISLGSCRLHYRVRKDMVNGFDIAHGGILFSASDSALAFACNSHGRVSVALDATISFMRPARLGELMRVDVTEVYLGHKTSVYDIRTTSENGELICMFKGTAYRTSKEFQ